MHFRIADTFTDSPARLTGDEQKAAKTPTFYLQLNPAQATNCAPAALAVRRRTAAAACDQPIKKLAISRSTN
jgi:hypothetical protein